MNKAPLLLPHIVGILILFSLWNASLELIFFGLYLLIVSIFSRLLYLNIKKEKL
tara:strand:+ start:6554 stop:6715 length:162 start_codon:yes stop_codon:yes gene_type:complete